MGFGRNPKGSSCDPCCGQMSTLRLAQGHVTPKWQPKSTLCCTHTGLHIHAHTRTGAHTPQLQEGSPSLGQWDEGGSHRPSLAEPAPPSHSSAPRNQPSGAHQAMRESLSSGRPWALLDMLLRCLDQGPS